MSLINCRSFLKKQGCGSGSAWIRIYFPSWIRSRIYFPEKNASKLV